MVQHLYRISKQHVEDVWFFLQTNNVDLFQVKPPVYAFLSGETISYIVCKNQTFTGLCTDISNEILCTAIFPSQSTTRKMHKRDFS